MLARAPRLIAMCLLAAAAPAATALGFAGLEQLIAEKNVRSIEQLLPLLPTDLRSRYVLMFRSRSLHGSSFANPRAILFDPEARFVLSFNGNAGQAGFQALETMEFDDADKSFRFREILFPAYPAPDGAATAGVRVSAANPSTCARCHGEPARPVWDTHPTWPGAYGEHYDAGLNESERSGLREFLQQQPAHPRYRYLLGVDRFSDPETFRPSARTRYEGEGRLPPNAELAAALGRLNFASIVHQLESRPEFDSYKYALVAALDTDCGRLDEFFPQDRRAGLQEALQRFAAASAEANAAQARSKGLRAAADGESDARGYGRAADIEPLDRFRFLVEAGFGLSTGQWTTALEKDSYDFAWSPSAAAEMAAYLRKRVARASPDTRTLADFRTFSGRDPYCAHLVRHSREALRDAPAALAPVAGRGPDPGPARTAALLQRCAGCHLGGVGPRLPFDRPAELAALLRAGHFAHGTLMDEIRWRLGPEAGAGRMPLGVNLSDGERDALLRYFAALPPPPATP